MAPASPASGGAEFRDRKTPELLQEEAEAATLGIRVEYVEDEVTASSSYLVNHFLSPVYGRGLNVWPMLVGSGSPVS